MANITYGIIDVTSVTTEEEILERGYEVWFESVGKAFRHLSGQNDYQADIAAEEYVPYTVGSCKKMIVPIFDGEIFADIILEVVKSYANNGGWDDDDMSFDISDAEVACWEAEDDDLITTAEEFCIAAPDFCIAAPGEL